MYLPISLVIPESHDCSNYIGPIACSDKMKRPCVASGTADGVKRFMCKSAHVTASGMASVLEEVRQGGLPEAFSRRTQYRTRQKLATAGTDYGPLVAVVKLPLKGTGSDSKNIIHMDLHVQAPLPMLLTACKQGPFATMLGEALARKSANRAQPWNLVLYSDEVTPGNALKPDNRRKIQCVYWSFLELGAATLCHTESWFLIAAVRSSLVTRLDGGMSHLFKVLMPLFFGTSHHLTNSGVSLLLHGQHHVLHAKLGVMVSDEAALKAVLQAKGAAGMKPCVCCMNVVSKSSQLHVHDASNYLEPMTSLDVNKWIPQTDESVMLILQKLKTADRDETREQLAQMEKILGFNHCIHNVIHVPEFLPMTIVMWDWMHIYLVNGIFNHEIGILMKALRAQKAGWERLNDYMALWTWPRATGSAATLCDGKRAKSHIEANSFKVSASEGLSACPVLAKYLHDVVTGALPDAVIQAVTSARMLCAVIRLLHMINRNVAVQPVELRAAIISHLRCYQDAYGTDGWVPKHHYSLHLPRMLADHGTLISCFTHERKHKVIKRYTQYHENTTALEKGIIEEITMHHLHALDESSPSQGLVSPVAAPAKLDAFMRVHQPEAGTVRSANAFLRSGCTFSREDVVAMMTSQGLVVGEVCFFASVDDEVWVCISVWEHQGATSDRSARYRVQADPRLFDASCLREALIYSRALDEVTVIWP
jgi:hypothetical protein